MTNFDYNDYVSTTKIVANKAKVIADAFAHEYIDHVDHVTVAMIESNPDSYVYLFTAMHDLLYEVCRRLETIDTESAKQLTA